MPKPKAKPKIETDEHGVPLPSRTELKRQIDAIKKYAIAIIDMSEGQSAKLDMFPELLEAVQTARRLRHGGAKKRQLLYVTRLLNSEQGAPTLELCKEQQNLAQGENAYFKKLERLRDELLSGSDADINTLIEQIPNVDRSHIRQLVRSSRKESTLNKPPKSARKLFQYLRAIHS